MELLAEFRPCFTAPTFTTFVLLAAGLAARPAGRTVCGMLAGAGLGGVWHHSRAHRFFATAAWSADALIAAAPARRGRALYVVADNAYICTELRALGAGVTLTGPMPRHATLYDVHPELDYPPLRRGQRGRPAPKAPRSAPRPARRGQPRAAPPRLPGTPKPPA